jgi:hypothetical protein
LGGPQSQPEQYGEAEILNLTGNLTLAPRSFSLQSITILSVLQWLSWKKFLLQYRHNCDTEFYFSSDVVTKMEAIAMLKAMQEGKEEREEQMKRVGYPAYTTQAGSCSLLHTVTV